ncbi:MAG: 6-phosphofructokinase [Phycisphaerae bacterium]|nr:6-phosphofructokinase [Phycisphaerae bacterium]
MAKSNSIHGNAVVGQSGGPTCVINQSLVGVIEQFTASARGKLFGMRHGVAGLSKEDLVDLTRVPKTRLAGIAQTPSAALGSSRDKPDVDYCQRLFEVCRKRDIRYFFYIGGNDSADTARIVNEVAASNNYPLHVFHIPKTIDNDLRVNDHTPGYGSAAKWVASAFIGDDMDNRSLPGVKINVVMGRNAGFLTAASVLARVARNSGPHLVYVPEVDFSEAQFVADVQATVDRIGRCVVAVSEGVHRAGECALAGELDKNAPIDAHGNKLLSGGALGDHLVRLVKGAIHAGRVRSDTFGYLQRCFPGVVSKTDAAEARKAAQTAVKLALRGEPSGSVAIIRTGNRPYKVAFERTELANVARKTKHLDLKYVNKAGNNILDSFKDYVAPLAGELPKIELLV